MHTVQEKTTLHNLNRFLKTNIFLNWTPESLKSKNKPVGNVLSHLSVWGGFSPWHGCDSQGYMLFHIRPVTVTHRQEEAPSGVQGGASRSLASCHGRHFFQKHYLNTDA